PRGLRPVGPAGYAEHRRENDEPLPKAAITSCAGRRGSSFPGSAWERTAIEALPRLAGGLRVKNARRDHVHSKETAKKPRSSPRISGRSTDSLETRHSAGFPRALSGGAAFALLRAFGGDREGTERAASAKVIICRLKISSRGAGAHSSAEKAETTCRIGSGDNGARQGDKERGRQGEKEAAAKPTPCLLTPISREACAGRPDPASAGASAR